jgi:hypothetical protein
MIAIRISAAAVWGTRAILTHALSPLPFTIIPRLVGPFSGLAGIGTKKQPELIAKVNVGFK